MCDPESDPGLKKPIKTFKEELGKFELVFEDIREL